MNAALENAAPETLLGLILLISAFSCGVFTMGIFARKGKPKVAGFALGFLLNLLGVIIALFVPSEDTEPVRESAITGTVQPNPAFYVAGAGALLVVLGSFLPWISVTTIFGTVSVNGIEADGQFTLVFGILSGLGILLVIQKPGKRAWGAASFALLTLVISIVDLFNASERLVDISSDYTVASIGIGLYLVVLGGFLGLAGFSRNSSAPRESPVKTCPQCAEVVKVAARICRYCGYQFSAAEPATTLTPSLAGVHAPRAFDPSSSPPTCPEHGIEMVIRISVKGPNRGKRFYVCPKYRACQQLIQLDP